jgi:hypothetical protein
MKIVLFESNTKTRTDLASEIRLALETEKIEGTEIVEISSPYQSLEFLGTIPKSEVAVILSGILNWEGVIEEVREKEIPLVLYTASSILQDMYRQQGFEVYHKSFDDFFEVYSKNFDDSKTEKTVKGMAQFLVKHKLKK